MNHPETPLDAMLRKQNLPLDDGGFTARVIQSLPRRRRAWWRPAILLTVTGIGSIFAGIWLPWTSLTLPASLDTLLSDSPVGLAWITTLSLTAALAWGVISSFDPVPENGPAN